MLGRVQKVSVSGEHIDVNSAQRVLIDDDERRQATDQMLLAAAEIDYQEEIIRQREAGINNIQRDVHRVHELFQDVAIHVSHQGQTLDHIEANVTSARDRTGEANTQLSLANRRGGGTRQNLLCLVLIAILILILLVMIKSLFKPSYFLNFTSPLTPNDNSSLDRIFQI
jgi:t-SNARE complex subunit (syntaxin)